MFSDSFIHEMIKRDVKKGLATNCLIHVFVSVVEWGLQCVLKDKILSFNGTSSSLSIILNHPDYVAKINDDNKFEIFL